ncbi:MAG TPA: peptidoglycan-binding protein [Solirubrobacteraceae bacterium]|jgi:peptidoglycan hydrolase-like protein with peptidoglycan-binding domain|nr:peptidoglycan-binding protein [Solirubrobacteraceae bacterium]
MPGFPRDLAVADPWETSLVRSRARRERTEKRAARSPMRLANLMDARNRLPSPRNLADSEPWERSTLRSRTRRRASEIQFVPTATRARRVSLGTLIAIAAGPAAGLADASGTPASTPAPAPEPTTTTTHYITLENGEEGRQVRLLQHALGIHEDGVFGPETEAAVRAFQASHGLEVDGVVGPKTGAALADNAAPIATSAVLDENTPALATSADVVDTETTTTTPATDTTVPETTKASMPAVNPIVRLQETLGVQVDGTFGPETEAAVKHAQTLHHIVADGVVGPETWRALSLHGRGELKQTLFPARHRSLRQTAHASGAHIASGTTDTGGEAATNVADQTADTSASAGAPSGNPVSRLQEALHISADGQFGAQTEAAVKQLQARDGLTVDGVVGPETWRALGLDEHATLHPSPRFLPSSTSSTGATGGGSQSSSTGGEASGVIARVIAAADEIATRPYVYGGGHGSFESAGYDCSGSVSYALHGGGLLSSPEDSSALESYGEPGPGRYITIYADAEHAWMTIDGRRYDTVALQESGSRWSDSMTSTAGYVVRHPAGL